MGRGAERQIMTRALVLVLVLLSGCAAKPTLYSWGSYEGMVYSSYSEPGKLSPEDQILKMEEDYQKARARNKKVHPGFHAHLGYLYASTGKVDSARQEFATEKAEFPESAVLMDRLIANLDRK